MSLSANGLKNAMLNELDLSQEIDGVSRAYIEDRIEKLANAIIEYITANADISTTVTGTCPPGGGPLVGGTGTGTVS